MKKFLLTILAVLALCSFAEAQSYSLVKQRVNIMWRDYTRNRTNQYVTIGDLAGYTLLSVFSAATNTLHTSVNDNSTDIIANADAITANMTGRIDPYVVTPAYFGTPITLSPTNKWQQSLNADQANAIVIALEASSTAYTDQISLDLYHDGSITLPVGLLGQDDIDWTPGVLHTVLFLSPAGTTDWYVRD